MVHNDLAASFKGSSLVNVQLIFLFSLFLSFVQSWAVASIIFASDSLRRHSLSPMFISISGIPAWRADRFSQFPCSGCSKKLFSPAVSPRLRKIVQHYHNLLRLCIFLFHKIPKNIQKNPAFLVYAMVLLPFLHSTATNILCTVSFGIHNYVDQDTRLHRYWLSFTTQLFAFFIYTDHRPGGVSFFFIKAWQAVLMLRIAWLLVRCTTSFSTKGWHSFIFSTGRVLSRLIVFMLFSGRPVSSPKLHLSLIPTFRTDPLIAPP